MQLRGFKFFVESVGLVSVYIDSCVWNRHYDDPSGDRNRREAQALDQIMGLAVHGEVRLVFSQALQEEMIKHPDLVQIGMQLAKQFIKRTPEIDNRARTIQKEMGLGDYDALHVASAEEAGADFLITVDDRMLKKANRGGVHVRLVNPLDWLKSSGFGNRAKALAVPN